MPETNRSIPKDSKHSRNARVRSTFYTSGPKRISGGRISRQYLSRSILVREIEASSPAWPEEFDGLRIAHLSDCHLDTMKSLACAESVVREIASREPDFVAGTGNVIDLQHAHARTLLDALANIGAPLGTALVLSNDDERHASPALLQMVKDAGLMLLGNETVAISRNGSKLIIAGIRGATSAARCASHVEQSCHEFAHILLAHNPKAFGKAAELGIPMTLSGHANHGHITWQTGPDHNPRTGGVRHRYRIFENGPSRLCVTVGGGDRWSPRNNNPPEFAMITMRHASQAYIVEDDPPKKKRRRKRKTS